MNFLNSSCLSRYTRLPFWTKDRIASGPLINFPNNRVNKTPCRLNPAKIAVDTQCIGKHHFLTSLTSWIQVRYNEKSSQLHRDMEFPNFDKYRKDEFVDVRKTDWGSGDYKPGITYVIGFFGLLCGAYGLKAECIHYVMFMAPPADVLALASIELDISSIAPGGCMSIKWRGKPLFIRYRTQVDMDNESKTPMSALRDPETEEQRTLGRPQWLVVIGICTHLGCVPIPNSGDWPGGFYCPCHGSHYDNIGRTRKGPAPTNLEVPPYKFITDTLINVG